MAKAQSRQTSFSLLRFSGVLLLVSIYALSGARLNTVHRLFHADDHSVEHLAQNEKDPCHRAIYHKDATGCEHTSHLSEVNKCVYCDITAVPDHLELPASEGEARSSDKVTFIDFSESTFISQRLNISARAPPQA